MIRIIFTLAALLLASPALAQNPTCPTRPAGDDSNACASTAFVQNSISMISIKDYCPTTPGDATCLQAAINAAQAIHGILVFDRSGYSHSGELVISSPMSMLCSPANVTVQATITKSGSGTNLTINSGYVNIYGCTFSGGTEGIAIGKDAVRLTDAGFTATSTTMTTSQDACTAADIGKGIYAGGAGPASGPLFTTVTGCLSSTQFVMANAASTTISPTSAGLGFNYQEVTLSGVTSYNCGTCLYIYAATQFHIIGGYYLGDIAMRRRQIIWGDMGSGQIIGNTFIANSAVGNALLWNSGGADQYTSNSFLGQGLASDCVRFNTEFEGTLGPWFANNDIEACTSIGIRLTANGPTITNFRMTGGSIVIPVIALSIDGSTASTVSYSSISDVAIQGPATCINIGQSTAFQANNNTCVGVTTAYAIGANATDAVIAPGPTNATTFATNSGTRTKFLPGGTTTVAAAPSAVDGSVIYFSNGNPGTYPCSAGGAGAVAIRAAGSWRCEATAFTGTGNYVLSSGSSQANPTFTGSVTATGLVKNSDLANVTAPMFKGRSTAGTGAPEDLTAAQALAILKPAFVAVDLGAVDFNAVADTAVNFTLPTGVTAFKLSSFTLHQASADMTTATAPVFRLFTATGGGGTALCVLTTATINTASSLTSIGTQTVGANPSDIWIPAATNPIYFRVTTAHGSALTAKVTVVLQLIY